MKKIVGFSLFCLMLNTLSYAMEQKEIIPAQSSSEYRNNITAVIMSRNGAKDSLERILGNGMRFSSDWITLNQAFESLLAIAEESVEKNLELRAELLKLQRIYPEKKMSEKS